MYTDRSDLSENPFELAEEVVQTNGETNKCLGLDYN